MSVLKDRINARIVKYAMDTVLGKDVDTPKDKLQQEELLEMVDRLRDRCGLFHFLKPKDHKLYYAKQEAFVLSRAPVKMFCGSNQSGKTMSLAAELLSWALGEYLWSGEPVLDLKGKPVKPPIRIFWGAKSFTMAHTEVTMPKIQELLPLEAIGVEIDKQQGRSAHRLRFPADLGGSTIKFQSFEQDPEDYEGTTWHIAGFDEPPPRHAYVGIKRGCMKHSAPILFSFTPLKEPWLFDEVYSNKKSVHVGSTKDFHKIKKGSYVVVNVDIDDSPYLTKEAKEEFLSSLDDEEREARAHGRWVHLLGRIYKDFSREKHVLGTEKFYKDHPDWKSYTSFMVVDPHDRRPFACIWGVITPRNEVVVIDEWPNSAYHRIRSWDNKTSEYVELFKKKEQELGLEKVFYRLIDPNFGITPKAGTGRTLIEEFDNYGVYFDHRIDNELESGHMVVREALRSNALFFLDHCTNMIKSMESYTWDEFRDARGSARMPKEKPREAFKDFCDCIRYAIKYGVSYMAPNMTTAGMRPSGFMNGGMARRTG